MATVKFYPKSRGGKDTEVSIFAVFTKSRTERFQISTDEKILLRHWDSKSQSAKANAPDSFNINRYLTEFKSKLMSLYRDNRDKSFTEFKALAQGAVITDEKKSPLAVFDKFLSQYEQDKDKKTWQKYKALGVHLGANTGCDFAAMDWGFVDRFRTGLYSKGLQDSSVYKYIANLKTFLSWAEERNYPVNPIYKKWEVKHRVKEVISLTLPELERLESAILELGPSIGRDYLCLECRTGQRISDLKRFDVRSLKSNEWTFNRRKGRSISTKEVSVLFDGFSAPALDILKKHNFKLPELSEQKINKHIKTACKAVGINEEIVLEKWIGGRCVQTTVPKWKKMSTHIGRKTFITLALASGLSRDIVMEMVGIDDAKTLKHYKGKSDKAMRVKHLEEMNEKLKAS